MLIDFGNTKPGLRYFSFTEGLRINFVTEQPKANMYGEYRHEKTIQWERLFETDKEKLNDLKRQITELVEEFRQRF